LCILKDIQSTQFINMREGGDSERERNSLKSFRNAVSVTESMHCTLFNSDTFETHSH